MLEGYHYQNAYVTRDIEKAVETFRRHGRIDRELRFEGSNEVTAPGLGRVNQTNKLAFLWVGDLQYEFIEPGPGPLSLYRDGLPDDDVPAFHHICMRVPDWDEFRARVDGQPFPIAIEGGNERLRFLYLDARPLLGHYLEYVWMDDERWSQMGGQ